VPLQPIDARMKRQGDSACEEKLAGIDDALTFDVGLCLGVLKGLHYLSNDVCISPAISLKDIASVLTRFFQSYPEGKHDDFRERSLKAVRSAWPYGRRSDI
jgi:hypothetical protein